MCNSERQTRLENEVAKYHNQLDIAINTHTAALAIPMPLPHPSATLPRVNHPPPSSSTVITTSTPTTVPSPLVAPASTLSSAPEATTTTSATTKPVRRVTLNFDDLVDNTRASPVAHSYQATPTVTSGHENGTISATTTTTTAAAAASSVHVDESEPRAVTPPSVLTQPRSVSFARPNTGSNTTPQPISSTIRPVSRDATTSSAPAPITSPPPTTTINGNDIPARPSSRSSRAPHKATLVTVTDGLLKATERAVLAESGIIAHRKQQNPGHRERGHSAKGRHPSAANINSAPQDHDNGTHDVDGVQLRSAKSKLVMSSPQSMSHMATTDNVMSGPDGTLQRVPSNNNTTSLLPVAGEDATEHARRVAASAARAAEIDARHHRIEAELEAIRSSIRSQRSSQLTALAIANGGIVGDDLTNAMTSASVTQLQPLRPRSPDSLRAAARASLATAMARSPLSSNKDKDKDIEVHPESGIAWGRIARHGTDHALRKVDVFGLNVEGNLPPLSLLNYLHVCMPLNVVMSTVRVPQATE
jgi:hypothetical protein